MISDRNWKTIRHVFKRSLLSSFHYAVASVNKDGSPHVTPIGSLFLGKERTGFYFERFPKGLPSNLKHNQQVCIMAVNTGLLFWIKAIFLGKFRVPPGVRLVGTAGERRPATAEEVALFHKRIRSVLPILGKLVGGLRGYKLLWGDLKEVREIRFTSFEPIQFGAMTRGMWDVKET